MVTAAPFHDFGGLDLTSAPDQSKCLDNLNVDFDKPGALRSRDGYDNLNASASASTLREVSYFQLSNGAHSHVTLDATSTLRGYNSSGVSVTTTGHAGVVSFARFGSPTVEYLYIVGEGGVSTKRWDGTAFTAPAGMPTASCVAVQPADNRLVVGFQVDGGSTYRSRVRFSDKGDAETWTAANYVDLNPGDGEAIQALVPWRGMLFAFKRTKFFVFYGNTTNDANITTFNYRPVDTGEGCAGGNAAVAGPEGVYFVSNTGVYLTTGGPPQLVSEALDPYFRGSTTPFFQGTAVSQAGLALGDPAPAVSLTYIADKLYASLPTATDLSTHVTFVYYPKQKAWSYTDLNVRGATVSRRTADRRPTLVFVTGATGHFYELSPSYTTDDGVAITSRYRTGFYDLGSNIEKRIKKAQMWGTGTLAYSLSSNFGSLGTASNVTLGTAPAIARGGASIPDDGTVFSHQLASVSGGAWSVQRFHQEIQPPRTADTKSA